MNWKDYLPIQNLLKADTQYVAWSEQQTSNKKYRKIPKQTEGIPDGIFRVVISLVKLSIIIIDMTIGTRIDDELYQTTFLKQFFSCPAFAFF
jgi:hypothetical protein